MSIGNIDWSGLAAGKGLARGMSVGSQLAQNMRNAELQRANLGMAERQEQRDIATAQAEAQQAEQLRQGQSVIRGAAEALTFTDEASQNSFLDRRAEQIRQNGGDPSDTLMVRQMPFAERAPYLKNIVSRGLEIPELASSVLGVGGANQDGVRSSKIYSDGLLVQSTDSGLKVYHPAKGLIQGDEAQKAIKASTEFEQNQQFEIARAKGEGGYQADINLGAGATEKLEFAKLQGSQRANAIDGAANKVQQITSNIGKLDEAISLINQGASTGAIESRFFPSFTKATIALENIQNELTLDVLNAATFGSLSEKELQIARETALPTGLQPDDLRDYLVKKKNAQQKLSDYFVEQMDFLDNGGTVSQFVRMKKRELKKSNKDGGSKTLKFDAQGNLIQ